MPVEIGLSRPDARDRLSVARKARGHNRRQRIDALFYEKYGVATNNVIAVGVLDGVVDRHPRRCGW
jgi:hypothetical protein